MRHSSDQCAAWTELAVLLLRHVPIVVPRSVLHALCIWVLQQPNRHAQLHGCASGHVRQQHRIHADDAVPCWCAARCGVSCSPLWSVWSASAQHVVLCHSDFSCMHHSGTCCVLHVAMAFFPAQVDRFPCCASATHAFVAGLEIPLVMRSKGLQRLQFQPESPCRTISCWLTRLAALV